MANEPAGYKKVAVIKHDGCMTLYLFALYDDDIRVGDEVLVNETNDRYNTGLVMDIISPEEAAKNFAKKIIKEVVCKIDTSKFKEREKLRLKKQNLRNKMNSRRIEIQKNREDEYYASIDDEYCELLTEFLGIDV